MKAPGSDRLRSAVALKLAVQLFPASGGGNNHFINALRILVLRVRVAIWFKGERGCAKCAKTV